MEGKIKLFETRLNILFVAIADVLSAESRVRYMCVYWPRILVKGKHKSPIKEVPVTTTCSGGATASGVTLPEFRATVRLVPISVCISMGWRIVVIVGTLHIYDADGEDDA